MNAAIAFLCQNKQLPDTAKSNQSSLLSLAAFYFLNQLFRKVKFVFSTTLFGALKWSTGVVKQ